MMMKTLSFSAVIAALFLLSNVSAFTTSRPQSRPRQELSRQNLGGLDDLLPGLIFGGLTVASLIYNKTPETNEIERKEEEQKEVSKSRESLEEAEPVEKKEPVAKAIPESEQVVEPVITPPSEQKPKPRPAPVVETRTAGEPEKKRNIVQEVAMTKEQNEKAKQLARERKAKEEQEKGPEVKEKVVLDLPTKKKKESTVEGTSIPKKRKRKFLRRALQKVIAPWRNWDNIN